MEIYREPARDLPVRRFDVVIAGGGTGGVIAAIAAARMGARTALIEAKGYTGGLVAEGGTALHSFYNLYSHFNVPKKQVVGGIPWEIAGRMQEKDGATGQAEMRDGRNYDAVNLSVDVEVYKRESLEMLEEAGVHLFLNTFAAGAVKEEDRVLGVICESHAGREVFMADAFIDATGYGDLCAHAGAAFTLFNDHDVANSIGVGGVDVDAYYAFFEQKGAMVQSARGIRSGKPDRWVRVMPDFACMPEAFRVEASRIGMSSVITATRDDHFMFLKLNVRASASPVDRDAATNAEIELRKRQARAIELLREYIPGCEKAFIARSSPSLCIRRGRTIECDYDLTIDDVLGTRRFNDEILIFGFHDSAPRLHIQNGGWYGMPYRAICVRRLENLYAIGMLITSNRDAHMSTRNTVCCMAQGQAAGIAAALCAKRGEAARELPYPVLREALLSQGVILE